MPGLRALLAAVGLGAAVAVVPTAAAGADMTGPCVVTIDGVDVQSVDASDPGDAIEVGLDDRFKVTFAAKAGLQSHTLDIEFAGVTWSVADVVDKGAKSRSRYVSVADYRRFGVGLYELRGSAVLANGETCTGAALVRVTGTPFATAAGIGAGLLAVGGIAGVGLATARAARGAAGAAGRGRR